MPESFELDNLIHGGSQDGKFIVWLLPQSGTAAPRNSCWFATDRSRTTEGDTGLLGHRAFPTP
jgi:hypothetical protein